MTGFGISLLLRSIFRIKSVLHSKFLVFGWICPEAPVLFIQYRILLRAQQRLLYIRAGPWMVYLTAEMSFPWHRLSKFAMGSLISSVFLDSVSFAQISNHPFPPEAATPQTHHSPHAGPSLVHELGTLQTYVLRLHHTFLCVHRERHPRSSLFARGPPSHSYI